MLAGFDWDAAPCGLAIFNLQGEVISSNRTLLDLLGGRTDPLTHLSQMLTYASHIFCQTHLFPLLLLHGHAEEIFLKLKGSQGDIPVLVSARRDQELYVLSVMRVHQRSRMEEKLVTRERAGQALLQESLSDVQAARLELSETVKVLAETQKIARIRSMFWNWDDDRVYSRISEPGEVPGLKDHGKCLSDLLERLPATERDSVQRILMECKSSLAPLFVSFSMPSRDGSNAYFQVRGVVDHGDQDQPVGMIGSVQNVTEQRNLEDQLRQAQKVESLGQFAGGIAHDFNNLLSVMLGFIDLAQETLEETHPAFEDLVEARAAGTKGAKLVKKLLQFSRQESVEMADQDLNEILTGMEGLLSYLLGTAHSLEFHPGETSLPVRADASALEQVVVNLVVNARDAMPEGGTVQVTARKVGLDSPRQAIHGDIPAGDYVMVAVADTGVGIPPTMLTKIFLPFMTTKDKDKGTGLGLSVCHGIVTQTGGFFDVQTSSEGTRFSIYLPLASPSSEKLEGR